MIDNSENQVIKGRALYALFSLNNFDSCQYLLDQLNQLTNVDKWSIYDGLAYYGDSKALPQLIKAILSDPDPDNRFVAIKALGSIGDRSCIHALTHVKKYDKGIDYDSHSIASMAQKAIEAIEQREGEQNAPF